MIKTRQTAQNGIKNFSLNLVGTTRLKDKKGTILSKNGAYHPNGLSQVKLCTINVMVFLAFLKEGGHTFVGFRTTSRKLVHFWVT